MLTMQNFEVLALVILFDLKFHFWAFFVLVTLLFCLLGLVFFGGVGASRQQRCSAGWFGGLFWFF